MSKHHWLFPQIADPTPKKVQRLIRPIYPILWQSVMGPWGEFLHYRTLDPDLRDYTKGEVAQWLHPKIVRCAKRLCAEWMRSGHNDLAHGCCNGMFVVSYRDEIAITFKKLYKGNNKRQEETLFRSNYRTAANLDFWEQRQVGFFQPIPRVILGYLFEKEMTKLRIVVGHPRSRDLGTSWYFLVPNQSRMVARLFPTTGVTGGAANPAARGFTVIPVEEEQQKDVRESGQG